MLKLGVAWGGLWRLWAEVQEGCPNDSCLEGLLHWKGPERQNLREGFETVQFIWDRFQESYSGLGAGKRSRERIVNEKYGKGREGAREERRKRKERRGEYKQL